MHYCFWWLLRSEEAGGLLPVIYGMVGSGRKTEIAPMKEFLRDFGIPSSPGGLEAGRCVAQIGRAWWRFNVDTGVYTN
jgi:hypothetical protein